MNNRKNYEPSFNNVSEGEIWVGRNRRAQFIRALGLEPEPAGKNSRVAQEKSICRYCEYIDDIEKQELVLIRIYDEELPVERKPRKRKYIQYIVPLLMNHLQKNNGKMVTTKNKFFKDIGAVSQHYRIIPPAFYVEAFKPYEDRIRIEKVKTDLMYFREMVSQRFRDIINPVLNEMIQKWNIQYKEYPVVVTLRGEHVPIFEAGRIGLTERELSEKLKYAESWAASQIEIERVNEETNQKELITLSSFEDVIKHWKIKDYNKKYDGFIRKEYSWDYTYTAIEISLMDCYKENEYSNTDTDHIKKEFNKILCDVVQKTIETKYNKKYNTYWEKREKLAMERYEKDNKEEIKLLFEVGLYDQSKIKELYVDDLEPVSFRYPKSLEKRLPFFISYELSFDKEENQQVEKWIGENIDEVSNWKRLHHY